MLFLIPRLSPSQCCGWSVTISSSYNLTGSVMHFTKITVEFSTVNYIYIYTVYIYIKKTQNFAPLINSLQELPWSTAHPRTLTVCCSTGSVGKVQYKVLWIVKNKLLEKNKQNKHTRSFFCTPFFAFCKTIRVRRVRWLAQGYNQPADGK